MGEDDRVPRRWLVDAMNLIGARASKWWVDPDRAMRELVEIIHRFCRTTGDEVTLVFDRKPEGLEPTEVPRVVVASYRGRNAADHEIVEIVGGDDDPTALRVVTSDRPLRERVSELGAETVGAGTFSRRLDQAVGRTDPKDPPGSSPGA